MASPPPAGTEASSEPDEMEQSLEEELESIQNEQSIKVIPDPLPAAASGQEAVPAAESQQEDKPAATLDDPGVRNTRNRTKQAEIIQNETFKKIL